MLTMHCTHPDGETSEARFALTMEQALSLYGFDDEGCAADTLVDLPAFE